MELTCQEALVLLGLFERYINVKHQTTHVFMTVALDRDKDNTIDDMRNA